MPEKLIVKNFGPIKHVELDIKKVNVLIGEQGTGKSAIARLLNLFKSEGFLFGDFLDQVSLLNMYGFFFQDNTHIEYYCDDYDIIGEGFSIVFKGNNKEILERFSDIGRKFLQGNDFKLESEYYSLKEWFLENIGDCHYIPAERIANINLNLRRGEKGNLDQYLIDFANDFLQSIKIQKLNIPYLKNVTYTREDNKDIIFFNSEKLFLYQASSGFQSSIPMAIVIEYFTSIKEKIRFIIEEPELNLFPTTQNELIKYLIEKTSSEKNGLFIATHSPYTLTSLNNLLYAYVVGQKHHDKVAEEIEEKYWLNPDDVSAYMMKPDGTFEDIFDREENMIKAEKIDEVSKEINRTFNKLLDIEFKENEPNT